jgi:FkbM family methyltransferase
MFAKEVVQKSLRRVGLELVRYPPTDGTRERHVLQAILSKKRINCVIDVGANEGQYGRHLRQIGYAGRIVSFEPVLQSFENLARTSAGFPGEWKLLNLALGSVAGSAAINVCDGAYFSSFLTPREESLARFPQNRIGRTEVVEVKRLDDILCECTEGIVEPRVYLKMDTQGYDLEVIKGATQSLPKIVALQTEISFKPIYENMRNYADSLSTLLSLGFEVFDFMPVTRDGLGAIEMDCVMVRSESGF